MKTRDKYYITNRGNSRPTRGACGMMNTSERSGHHLTGDALTLAVRGTLDRLGAWHFMTVRTERNCPCCGQRSPAKVLSDSGRLRLKKLRRLAGETAQ